MEEKRNGDFRMKRKCISLGVLLLFELILLGLIFLQIWQNSTTCGGMTAPPDEDLAELYEEYDKYCEEIFSENYFEIRGDYHDYNDKYIRVYQSQEESI